MPIGLSELTTPSGHPVLKAVFSGDITVPEAQAYHAQLLPGQRYHFVGHLVVGQIRGVSADVKKVLSSYKADQVNPPPVAIVLGSAILSLVAGLVTRTTGNENTEYFSDEKAALEWLDERVAVFLKKAGK
jgi:hypothetical protein